MPVVAVPDHGFQVFVPDHAVGGGVLDDGAEDAGHDVSGAQHTVAEVGGQIAGCVSLVRFNASLCEVRSLAVHPTFRGKGIASALVREALALAEQRGIERVLVLTRAAALFEKLGFRRDFVANFPEKVWRDCAPCPFRHACDEVALIYPIHEKEPIGVRPVSLS